MLHNNRSIYAPSAASRSRLGNAGRRGPNDARQTKRVDRPALGEQCKENSFLMTPVAHCAMPVQVIRGYRTDRPRGIAGRSSCFRVVFHERQINDTLGVVGRERLRIDARWRFG